MNNRNVCLIKIQKEIFWKVQVEIGNSSRVLGSRNRQALFWDRWGYIVWVPDPLCQIMAVHMDDCTYYGNIFFSQVQSIHLLFGLLYEFILFCIYFLLTMNLYPFIVKFHFLQACKSLHCLSTYAEGQLLENGYHSIEVGDLIEAFDEKDDAYCSWVIEYYVLQF